MSPQQPVTAEDLYLYAMQLLEPEEHARLQEFLLHSPEARAELANVRGDLALLAFTTEQQAPSPLTRQRLLNQIGREKKTSAEETLAEQPATAARTQTDERRSSPALVREDDTYTPSTEAKLPFRSFEEEEPRRSIFGLLFPWAGWAVAAGLAISTYSLWHRNLDMQEQVTVASAKVERTAEASAQAQKVLDVLRNGAAQRFQLTKQSSQPIPNARVTYVAQTGSLVFQGANLDQLPTYKVYELWLIPVGEGRTPIPAGTFRPDERGYASVILPELPKGVVASTFGVTEEDDGGAKTPTLPILMIGS